MSDLSRPLPRQVITRERARGMSGDQGRRSIERDGRADAASSQRTPRQRYRSFFSISSNL